MSQTPGPARARYGSAAFAGASKSLPDVFPRTMGPNTAKYVQEVVDAGLAIDMTGRFEQAFAKELGAKHFVGSPGCTNALHILMAAMPYAVGDEIIVSPVADYGTISGLVYEGFVPVFCDSAPGTAHCTAETIAACITPRTRAILVVHVIGHTPDMDPIIELAKAHKLDLFEDVCQAVFAGYKGRIAGTLGKASGFSFDSEKTMGSDVGGGVACSDEELHQRLRFIGHSRGGVSVPGFGRVHTERGLALRMTSTTGAICLGQLEIIRGQVAARDRTVRKFTAMLGDIPGVIPYPIPAHCTTFSCWMYGFSIDPRAFTCTPDAFAAQMVEAGIPNAGLGQYYLMNASLPYLNDFVRDGKHQFAVGPSSKRHEYKGDANPNAQAFLKNFIRWFWTEKYNEEHLEIMLDIVAGIAEKNRR
ncbi:MAG: DegT/DnrJ/EryC1/StrS aminotransferase family protein [Planctomycetota bacterium]|nr:DegT/DnrJ/EryC1/StrS aminotransferase family protein [Planctomycetota bacterium]